MRQHPPLQIRMPLSEAVIAAYIDCIGFQQDRERNGLLSQQGGVKGRLGQQQARGRLWAACPLVGRAAR